MFRSLSEEAEFARSVTHPLAQHMREVFFGRDMKALKARKKADGTWITALDEENSEAIEEAYRQRGIPAASEESGKELYGTPNIILSDPIDDTKNLVERMRAKAPTSTATIALSLVKQYAVMGVVEAPLLSTPVTYTGFEGRAYRYSTSKRQRLTVSNATRGIVLVSDTGREDINTRLRDCGFQPLLVSGSVFKAMALVNPTILGLYDRDLAAHGKTPIVGFVSTGAWTHDYAASSAIVKAARGIATATNGDPLPYHPDTRGCVMANTPAVHSLLVEVMTA